MKGLSEGGFKSIEKLIKTKFDIISLRFLGIIPTQSQQKSIIFKTSRQSLISLFLQALGTRDPNKLEERSLKTMLRLANGYMNTLRDKTSLKVASEVDSYLKNQHMKDKPVSMKKVNEIIDKEMDKAKNHVKLIANAESNKAINTGTALQISKMAKQSGEKDPTVFFVVIDDSRTGFYEYILHLLPDRKTPRVWKLSEIQAGYYKDGDQYPSVSGLHPSCRCKLTYLAEGWGFDEDGKIAYISKGHDEFKVQREKYGLPEVPSRPRRKNKKWVFND